MNTLAPINRETNMAGKNLIPMGQEGSTFQHYRENVYAVPLFSRISIQLIDPTAYPTQIKILESFLSDVRDTLYATQEEKIGKSLEMIEKIDARLCLEMSNKVRELNTTLNNVHGLSGRFPILIQNRGRPLRKRRLRRRDIDV
jgi:hypothetical protein